MLRQRSRTRTGGAGTVAPVRNGGNRHSKKKKKKTGEQGVSIWRTGLPRFRPVSAGCLYPSPHEPGLLFRQAHSSAASGGAGTRAGGRRGACPRDDGGRQARGRLRRPRPGGGGRRQPPRRRVRTGAALRRLLCRRRLRRLRPHGARVCALCALCALCATVPTVREAAARRGSAGPVRRHGPTVRGLQRLAGSDVHARC